MLLELLPALGQHSLHGRVAYLFEISIPFAHRAEPVGNGQADEIVRLPAKTAAALFRPNRDGNDYLCGLEVANVREGRPHGASRGKAIVDQDNRLAADIQRWFASAKEVFPPPHFRLFAFDHRLDFL